MTSQIVALAFEGEHLAEGMLKTIQSMQERGLLKVEDAVIASKGVSTHIEIKQTHSEKGKFALRGSGVGLLAGLLLGGPIVGLAAGAAIGAIGGSMKDYGIEDKFIEQISKGLHANSSALFLMVSDVQGEKVLEELSNFQAIVLTTSLSEEQHKRLEDALAEEK